MANKVPVDQLTSECMGTMFGGVINLANMLPYGTFCVCENEILQEQLYKELGSVWENSNDAIPNYAVLSSLPLLVRALIWHRPPMAFQFTILLHCLAWLIRKQSGTVKESLRLMHGIITGPPRVTPLSGAQVDGYNIPPKVCSWKLCPLGVLNGNPNLSLSRLLSPLRHSIAI